MGWFFVFFHPSFFLNCPKFSMQGKRTTSLPVAVFLFFFFFFPSNVADGRCHSGMCKLQESKIESPSAV